MYPEITTPCYFSGAGNGSLCYELYDKTRLQPDIAVIANVADEVVNSMGQKVNYYVNTTTTTSADLIYGEQPTAVYHGPKVVKMIINLTEANLALSKFGFVADDDVVAYMSFNTFMRSMCGDNIYTQLNHSIEPKSGDVFQMTEYGSDRVDGRSGNYFQITERKDQEVGNNMNPLGGHYGWQIKAKRMEYSWEPGLPQETVNNQTTDDTFYGKLTSTIAGEVSSVHKSYEGSADHDSKHFVIDMGYNDTSVYGTYDLSDNDYVVPSKAKHLLDVADNESLLISINEELQILEDQLKKEHFIRYNIDAVDGGQF